MNEEDILALIRNNNFSDEQIVSLAYMLLNEVCNKKETPSSCFLCGGDKEYLGKQCEACT